MSQQDHVIWKEPETPIMLKMPEPLGAGDPESVPIEKLLQFFAREHHFTLHTAKTSDDVENLRRELASRPRRPENPAPIIKVLSVMEIGERIKVQASTFETGRPDFVVNLNFAPTVNNAGQVFSMIF